MGGTEQLVATMAVQTPNRIGNEQLDLLAYRRLALLSMERSSCFSVGTAPAKPTVR